MDIMWIVENGGLCGGVKVILEYATRLARRGHKCVVASLDYQPNWFDCSNIDWWVFPEYDSMMKHIKEAPAKKIATWWKTAHFLQFGANEGEGYYLVQDIESSYYFRPSDRAAAESTYNLGLKMFTPNRWVTTQLNDVTDIGQAYDASLYKRSKYAYPVKNRALSIARRQSLKGFSELGEMSRRMAVMNKDAQLLTFGMEPVIKLVGAHKGHISFPPDREIVNMYSQGSVYACTSQHEGFGLPMLEAMACGCPVVTTDCEGNYFCQDGVNCLKYDKHDMRGMAEGALRLFKDDVLSKKLATNGLETAREFSNWDSVIDKLEQVLT